MYGGHPYWANICQGHAFSFHVLLSAMCFCLPWSFEESLGPPRVQAPKRPHVLPQELRNPGIVLDRNRGTCGLWPVERVAIGDASLGQDCLYTRWCDHPKPKQILLADVIQDFLRRARTRYKQNPRCSDEVDREGGEVRSRLQIQDSLDLAGSLGSPKPYS